MLAIVCLIPSGIKDDRDIPHHHINHYHQTTFPLSNPCILPQSNKQSIHPTINPTIHPSINPSVNQSINK